MHLRIFRDVCASLLALSAVALVVLHPPASPYRPVQGVSTFVLLAVGAAASAWLATSNSNGRPVRLAPAFVLAGLLVLPPGLAIAVVVIALGAARGAGVLGAWQRGIVPFASVTLAAVVALFVSQAPGPAPALGSAWTFLHLVALFVLLQGCSLVLTALLVGLPRDGTATALQAPLQMLFLEGIGVPLAWVLVALVSEAGVLPSAVFGFVVLAGAFGMRELDRALRDLKATNDVLAARVTELATLHAIGREIASTLDPERVFTIVERECRKIFDVDLFFIALVDPDAGELRFVYRRRGDEIAQEKTFRLGAGFAAWVVTRKRPCRVDDFRERPEAVPVLEVALSSELRSALAVPLVVEDRVIGVISVQSERPRAYDDQHLAVLTTIAQQAAVAIENARHYEMATVDSLTRLYLRDYFFRRLEEEHTRARRYRGTFAILMMDLDRFKAINDRHGHLAGDRYLRVFGATLRSKLRGADLACRYGGEEFCLLLPETDLEGARVIAERIRLAVFHLRVDAEDVALRTTLSIGIAAFPDHDSGDLKGLLRKADQALYQAKRAGRDRVVPFAA